MFIPSDRNGIFGFGWLTDIDRSSGFCVHSETDKLFHYSYSVDRWSFVDMLFFCGAGHVGQTTHHSGGLCFCLGCCASPQPPTLPQPRHYFGPKQTGRWVRALVCEHYSGFR